MAKMQAETKSPGPSLAVLYEPGNGEPKVDIIAVHGIGVDADSTWTTNGVNWLRDLLPKSAPEARIMRFSYESRWMGEFAIHQHISNVANLLLEAIRSKREQCPTRPIVFIAHCYGGIAVSKAIIKIRTLGDEYMIPTQSDQGSKKTIVDCIAGILFLGTPFRGTKSRAYAEILGNILKRTGHGNSDIFQPDQSMKADLNDFVRIANQQSLPLCCVFEQKETDIAKVVTHKHPLLGQFGKHKEVVVPEDSASIDGVKRLGVDADHFKMNKFSSVDDPNYVTVLQQLGEMIKKAPDRVKSRLNPKSLAFTKKDIASEPRRRSLSALWHENPHEKSIAIPEHIGESRRKTHEWLLAHRVFTEWLNEDDAPLLWIHGGAQRELFISLIATLTNKAERSSRHLSVGHDFCASGHSPRKILHSLMYHVLCQYPDAIDIWSLEYYKFRKESMSQEDALSKLWQLIQRTLGFANVDVAYFILGSPENCEPGSLDKLFSLTMETNDTKCRIKWVVVSLKDAAMEKLLSTYLQINVEDSSEIQDVAKDATDQDDSS
ncbi:MAG: hypothetical protein MMC33_008539 [Icmadophila ericetorum]|nr:hypothetical protein [Icmadophila ericetorum]